MRPLEARFDQQRRCQQALITRLRLLSPAVLVQQRLSAIVGADAPRYFDFQAQVRAFGQRFEPYFVGKVFRRELLHAADYARLPAFQYQPPATRESTAASLLNAGWRLLLTVLLAVLGLAATRSGRLAQRGPR